MKGRIMKLAAAAALVPLTGACALGPVPRNIPLMTGSAPTLNSTPANGGFQCVASQLQNQRTIRLAVGEVKDYTGKFSNEASEGGFKITQGGSLMVISALGKLEPKIQQVERYDTRIAEQENTLSRNQLIQDPNGSGAMVRPVTAGQYHGSDYYIVGGITEVNYNISSGGLEASVMNMGGGYRYYAMTVAADLRLVDSKTLQIIKTVPIRKTMVGYEVKAGVFSFFGNTLVDLNAGRKDQEPLQLGVRSALEYGVLDLVMAAYGLDFDACRKQADYGFEHPLNVASDRKSDPAVATSASGTARAGK